jgi:surface antigen
MKPIQLKTLVRGALASAALGLAVLVLPAVAHGASYTVQSGDWLSTIAPRFGTTWQTLCTHNRLSNCNAIFVGQVLDIPSGSAPASAPVYAAQPITRASGGPNGYGPGWCTWYVKERRPDIGGYWGNAGYNWISAAQSAGFATGSTPRAGAIGVMPGHVVYVESVSGNMVNISEMGWNYTAWLKNYRTVPASSFTYIY